MAADDHPDCYGDEAPVWNKSEATPLLRWKNFNRHQQGSAGIKGTMRHANRRAKQATAYEDYQDYQTSSPSNTPSREKLDYSDEEQEQDHALKSPLPAQGSPLCYPIELNWKWPDDVDYSINPPNDVMTRSVVMRERSVFVGCVPDDVDNIGEILQSLMERFLERFDFAPAALSQIQLVTVLKDFAFLELATDKVAQIILAANQLDVFEWGANGYYFNIEGCNGTHTSVRPLIEHVPLKPARVVFVGNIPKSHWQKDYLEAFFSKILWASDGPTDAEVVTAAHLLPESCDAYLELASEFVADALIYKCTKNPHLLKDIGEDVFLCRDTSSIPMMSRHDSVICPQRSLFIGFSAREEDVKIDCVRKVFDEILPLISRKSSSPAYLEYISMQPGKDYAFFQFNSEGTVDAIMDEYIENTHLFTCKSMTPPMAYIILRPPEYVRPGTRYKSQNQKRSRSRHLGARQISHQTRVSQPKQARPIILDRRRNSHASTQMLSRPRGSEQAGIDVPLPRSKKPDCVISMGVSPPPVATWNGLSSNGVCSDDPECMIVIEGLTKGISYKLLRGALNELFERELSHSGLLEVGMLVVRFLDRYEKFDLVASLPSADFACALLSLRKVFLLAGHEVRLLPAGTRRTMYQRLKPVALHGDGGEVSCSSDEEGFAEDWNVPGFSWDRKRGPAGQYFPHDTMGRDYDARRRSASQAPDQWNHPNEVYHGRMGHHSTGNFGTATDGWEGGSTHWTDMHGGTRSKYVNDANRASRQGPRADYNANMSFPSRRGMPVGYDNGFGVFSKKQKR